MSLEAAAAVRGRLTGQRERRESAVCRLPTSTSSDSQPTTRVTCPHAPSRCSKSKLRVTALTLVAKLHMGQVIRDPGIPVHFGNKSPGTQRSERERTEEKGEEQRGDAATKILCQCSGQAVREKEGGSQVVREEGRREKRERGTEGGDYVRAAVPAQAEVVLVDKQRGSASSQTRSPAFPIPLPPSSTLYDNELQRRKLLSKG